MMEITIAALRKAGLSDEEIVRICEAKYPYGGGKQLGGECWVYSLWFPPKKKPFYFGISRNPWVRFDNHRSDPACGGYPYVARLLKLGYQRDQILKIYKRCKDRNEAAELEFRLIETTGGVINLTKGKYWRAPTWQLQ